MKHKYGFSLFTFVAGVIIGIAAVAIYEIMSNPSLPPETNSEEGYEWTDDEIRDLNNISKHLLEMDNDTALKALSDTQPIRV